MPFHLQLPYQHSETIANMRAPRMWFNRLIITSACSTTVFKIKIKYVILKERMMNKKLKDKMRQYGAETY